MGLFWQQGPLASEEIGHFLVREPLPEGILLAREVSVRLDGTPLRPEPGQTVVPHRVDMRLNADEAPVGRPS